MGFKLIVDNEYGESLGEKWGWAKLPMKLLYYLTAFYNHP